MTKELIIRDATTLGIKIIKAELSNMPNRPGVYRMISKDQKVLYVGKAKDLAKRIVNYTQVNRLCQRMKMAIQQIDKLEIIAVETEAQALVLEANLIKSLKPKYNILLKDDKSMPYILVRQDHPYSQILKYRGNRDIKGEYFGPFASVKIVDDTIEFLEKNFLLRNCTDYFFSSRKTPCMQYQIQRCSAPCVNKISLKDYQNNVTDALTFLKGKSVTLQQEISTKMHQASEAMDYESAAKYRDQLRALNYIQNKNTNLFNIEEADVIAIAKEGDIASVQLFLFRNGQNYGNKSFFFHQVLDESIDKILEIYITQHYQHNPIPIKTIVSDLPEDYQILRDEFKINIVKPKSADELKVISFAKENAKLSLNRKYEEKQQQSKLMLMVKELFKIEHDVKRIEVLDNSHISGAHAIGALIVATEEGFSKKHYRKYNIKTTSIADDYAMLKEVLTRRLSKIDDENRPDLLLIDGGEGHLSAAREVIEKLQIDNIPYVCIAKGAERNAGKEVFHQVGKDPFTLDKHLPVMKYLQILRDEAHRYAITSHRAKRRQAINFSNLKLIPGIGPKRRKLLIDHFASIQDIKDASLDQLLKIDGINKKTAETIISYFKQNN